MADERCVFPGDNPRTPGRWLDRDAAERLLCGEPLDAVDADSRDQADRLAEALSALGGLTADSAQSSAELPGEEVALAAFRKAHTGRNGESSVRGHGSRTRSVGDASTVSPSFSPVSSDAGLIHLGGSAAHRRAHSRWGRPLRYGLAAALAAGMIGGVAVAATSGALSFGGEKPEPGSSATAAVTPDRPLGSPFPERTPGGVGPRPDSGPSESDVPRGKERGDTGTGSRPGSDDTRRQDRPGHGWSGTVAACRDYRDGKDLAPDHRRGLEDAANGAEQVKKYCGEVLKNWRRDSGDDRYGHGNGRDKPGRSGWGDDDEGNSDGGGRGDDEGRDGSHIGPGRFRDGRGTAGSESDSAESTALAPTRFLSAPVQAPTRTQIQTLTPAPAPHVSALTPTPAPHVSALTRPSAAATSALAAPTSRPSATDARGALAPRALPALASPS